MDAFAGNAQAFLHQARGVAAVGDDRRRALEGPQGLCPAAAGQGEDFVAVGVDEVGQARKPGEDEPIQQLLRGGERDRPGRSRTMARPRRAARAGRWRREAVSKAAGGAVGAQALAQGEVAAVLARYRSDPVPSEVLADFGHHARDAADLGRKIGAADHKALQGGGSVHAVLVQVR